MGERPDQHKIGGAGANAVPVSSFLLRSDGIATDLLETESVVRF